MLYRVPWPEGSSFTIRVAPGDAVTPHIAVNNRHAVDFSMPEGTPVLAARRGTVIETEARYGASRDEDALTYEGNYVRVRHEDGTIATYAHLMHRGVAVAPGKAVEAGALLGYSGATGDVTRPQLHFGVSRREEKDGARYEVSVPVLFYVGNPPVAFAPRLSLDILANYSSAAEPPRTTVERSLVPWRRPELPPGQVWESWLVLAALAAALVAGIAWYWRFSRSPP